MRQLPWLSVASLGLFAFFGVPPPAKAESVLVTSPLGAEDAPRKPRDKRWDVYGFGRMRLVGLEDFSLDTHGARVGRDGWLESRLLLGARYAVTPRFELTLELDALNGQAAGRFTTLGMVRGEDTFQVRRDRPFGGGILMPRKAFLRYDLPWGRLVVGQQAFGWGLGLLANDGATETDFGDVYQGSLVERAALFLLPFARKQSGPEWLRGLGFFAALDVPFRDDNASLLAGDFAWSALVGAQLRSKQLEAGVFESFRSQTDREDPYHPALRPTVSVSITDAYAKAFLTDRFASQTLQFEAEAAVIAGRSTRPYFEQTASDGAAVQSFGGAARLRFDDRARRLTAKLEIGHASGDNNAKDDVFRQFTFNTDYNVGLILFDQFLPMLTARSVDQISSPSKTGQPAPSVRHFVNQGAVSNTTYVYPTLRLRPFRSLDVRVGYVAAFGAADVVDPYQTAKNGGYNTTFGGISPGSRMLGHEFDLGLRYRFDLGRHLSLRIGYEAGIFFQGSAFSGLADMRPVWMARALTDFQF